MSILDVLLNCKYFIMKDSRHGRPRGNGSRMELPRDCNVYNQPLCLSIMGPNGVLYFVTKQLKHYDSGAGWLIFQSLFFLFNNHVKPWQIIQLFCVSNFSNMNRLNNSIYLTGIPSGIKQVMCFLEQCLTFHKGFMSQLLLIMGLKKILKIHFYYGKFQISAKVEKII